MSMAERTPTPDSLEEDTPRADVGVIKVANHELLNQLVAQSPLPIYKHKGTPRQPHTYRLVNTEDTNAVYDDMEEYKYVPTDLDDDLNLHAHMPDPHGLPSDELSTSLAPAAPYSHQIPQASHRRVCQIVSESTNNNNASTDKFIPPLQLTDSLVADDPEPNETRVVRDSLDSSLDEEDYQRLQNLMNSKEPLPNPFKPDLPTPNTLQELNIASALAANSDTPQKLSVNSRLDGAQVSVMSTYTSAEETTPRPVLPSQYHNITPQGSELSEPVATDNSYLAHHMASKLQNVSPLKQTQQAHSQYHRGDNSQQTCDSQTSPKTSAGNNYKPSARSEIEQSLGKELSPRHQPAPITQQRDRVVGSVAPKPPRPEKNFVERNKDKARGVSSAKSSYTSRLQHAKQQQEAMKQWAPGMIVPRKKAASADNAVRIHKDDDPQAGMTSPPRQPTKQAFSMEGALMSPEMVWEQRASQLTAAKSERRTRSDKRQLTGGDVKLTAAAQSEQTGRASITDARIQVDLNLRSTDLSNLSPHQYQQQRQQQQQQQQTGMRLIGPIPQQSHAHQYGRHSPNKPTQPTSQTVDSVIPQNPSQTYLAGLQGQPPSGPVQPHKPHVQSTVHRQQYVGHPSQHQHDMVGPEMSQITHYPPVSIHRNGLSPSAAQHQSNMTYHNKNITSNSMQPYSDYESAPPNVSRYYTMTNEELDQQVQYYANESYNQLYYQSHPQHSTLKDGSSVSRWNGGTKSYIPSEMDVTLDEVMALEENQSYERPPSINQSELNPYQAVPPITAESRAEQQSAQEGYAAIHKQQKEKGDTGAGYKQYTLKDYKKINKEVKLGGLGPSTDPSLIQQKREVRKKQLQIAKEAREMEAKKATIKPKQSDEKESKPTHPSGRQLAKEYSKTVPKPKVAAPKQEAPSPLNSDRLHKSSVPSVGGKLNSARSMSSLVPDTYRVQQQQQQQQQQNIAVNNTADRSAYNYHEKTIPNSFSSPSLQHGDGSMREVTADQFSYLDTIEMLHKRHLQEKQLLAGLRQKRL